MWRRSVAWYGSGMLGDASLLCCFTDGALDRVGEDVVTAGDAAAGIDGELPGGEDELPAPFAVDTTILAGKGVWELYGAVPVGKILA